MVHEVYGVVLKQDDEDRVSGKIDLKYLADPSTVVVSVLGKNVKPSSFDIFGNPIFVGYAALLLKQEEDAARKLPDNAGYTLEVDVSYEKAKPFKRSNENFFRFDSKKYFRDSLVSLSAFQKFVQDKMVFSKQTGFSQWTEYVFFGRYLLDSCCQLWTITGTKKRVPKDCPKVMTRVEFFCLAKEYSLTAGACIPTSKEKCPCCGKRFTIKDVRTGMCVSDKGQTYHKNCFETMTSKEKKA